MRSMAELGCVSVMLLCLTLGLAFMGAFFLIEAPLFLLFGWVWFLKSSVSQMQIDWSSVSLAAVALSALIIGIHRIGNRWAGQNNPNIAVSSDSQADERLVVPRQRWKFQWTACVVSTMLLMFTAGISVVGVTHQLVWLGASPDKIIRRSQFEAPERTSSKNNLKQIGLAIHNYSDTNTSLPSGGSIDQNGRPMHSAMTALLPYIEQTALYNSISLDEPWDASVNRAAFESRIQAFEFTRRSSNPEMEQHIGYALTNYAGNIHLLPFDRSLTMESISDGTSNTIIFGEVVRGLRPWADPLNLRDPSKGINKHPAGYNSPFTGGAQVLLCDGSVRFISNDIAPETLKALSTPNGGDVAGEF